MLKPLFGNSDDKKLIAQYQEKVIKLKLLLIFNYAKLKKNPKFYLL